MIKTLVTIMTKEPLNNPYGTYFVIKDLSSSIIDCNELFLQYVGVKSFTELMGRTDFELAWEKYAPLYRQHELDIINNNNYSVIHPSIDSHGREFMAFINKVPTVDEHNNITGIACYNMEIFNPNSLELHYLLRQNPYSPTTAPTMGAYAIGKQHAQVKLSNKESICLFYLLRGKTAKMIAKVLNLSHRTIEDHFNHLKFKFQCKTQSELIAKAIDEGFMDIIPPELSLTTLVTSLK